MNNILIFVPNCNQGGTERVAIRLSEMFSDENIENCIVTLCDNQLPYKYEGKHYHLETSGNKLSRFISSYKKLKKIVQDEKITHIISMGEYPNILNALMGQDVKKIARITNSFSSLTIKNWLVYLLTKLFYRKLDMIITPARYLENELQDFFGIDAKVNTIYNFLDIQKIEIYKKEKRDKKRIIHIGQLVEQKAQHYLLESFAKVKEQVEDVELLIIGKGEREEELKALTKQLKIENDVKFLGWQDNPFYWLQNSDVFVLTSLWEGMPNVVIESMACKCPVISFDCPSGPNEIINKPNENGILVEVGDVDKLTKDIVKVLSDDEYRQELSENAYLRALDFDIGKISKKYLEVLEG
ncbi:glycosyltransferase [Arcobacter sp. FWKO B]|uniref:glycosyltransferase n=1 Tax=Arcobacter sp. FWKO B TaxID=2593672 RepID=UPI0018A3B59D|nr:glycosyltransferase [Arcobacter sp. FWKO B]QOG12080.1 glycosyltransferase family 4 protein [Arcobacter sp. FWKO B]